MNTNKSKKLLYHQRVYITGFIESFIVPSYQNKWKKVLLESSLEKWDEISAWDLWSDSIAMAGYCKEWSKSLPELLHTSLMKPYANSIVLNIHLGHAKGNIDYCLVEELLLNKYYLFEGVVIINPHALALVINYDGGCCLCNSTVDNPYSKRLGGN